MHPGSRLSANIFAISAAFIIGSFFFTNAGFAQPIDSGSILNLSESPDPYASGSNALEFNYDNDGYIDRYDYSRPGYYSEIKVSSPVDDLTAIGAKAIYFSYIGNSQNDPEPIYMALSDGSNEIGVAVLRDPNGVMDSDATQRSEAATLEKDRWFTARFALSDFVAANPHLDLSDILSIHIGIGHRGNTETPGGSGTIYIDDIGFFPSLCIPEYVEGDFQTGSNEPEDCVSDLNDMQLLVENWLEGIEEVYSSAPQNSPVLWYKFDEAAGTTATDQAGRSDGTVSTDDAWQSGTGYDGSGCLAFDGNEVYLDLDDEAAVFGDIADSATFCVWLYGDAGTNPARDQRRFVFHASGSADFISSFICPFRDGSVRWKVGQNPADHLEWQGAEPQDWQSTWNHYALVRDGQQKVQRLYLNGLLVEEILYPSHNLSGIDAFSIGAHSIEVASLYSGKMDDFRIYDYALSQPEILGVAGESSVYQPLVGLPGDIDSNDNQIIDFADFSAVAYKWLELQLWP